MVRIHVKADSDVSLKSSEMALQKVFQMESQRTTLLTDGAEAVYLAVHRDTTHALVLTTTDQKQIALPNIKWSQIEMSDGKFIFYGKGFDPFSE
ncbi:hypothetical protein [Thermoactinomyces sp. DSM 45892]|uniref:hypothetical protein n=1 Tax=Thermoactinomyces sp. DSM 45892 TaxID=1882753 RepID=UPI00089CA2B7|nr:hypothetical protein [Thermoactinomyces sp. DSM 45892]SDY38097.1 hypothetical protein SAMN05444416_10498 [Thermoactinomyces sp. DSM 45892]